MKEQNDRRSEDFFRINIKIKEKLPGIQIRSQYERFYHPEYFQIQRGYHGTDDDDRHCG